MPRPLPLEEIPPLVFSEVMRDVDLFVGVASVGNDPTWAGRRPGRPVPRLLARLQLRRADRHRPDPPGRAGAAGAAAGDRRPLHLRATGSCIVRGDLRTYKIHLGCGNILMEPNDQYLCIVPNCPSRRRRRVFLPFEGDRTLSVILSKALLLADDTKITDPTILSQLRHRETPG